MNKGKSDAFDCVIFLLEQYNKFDIMKERNVLMYEIEFYENPEGFSKIKEYIMQLRVTSEFNKDSRINFNKIVAYFDLLQEMGTRIGEPVTKRLEGEIWELRPLRNRFCMRIMRIINLLFCIIL